MRLPLYSLLLSLTFLILSPSQSLADIGSILGGAGVIGDSWRRAESDQRRSRIEQLQLEEANRRADVQKLEYERRMSELTSQRQFQEVQPNWVLGIHQSDSTSTAAGMINCHYKTSSGHQFTVQHSGVCSLTMEIQTATGLVRSLQ